MMAAVTEPMRAESMAMVGDHLLVTVKRPTASQATRRALRRLKAPVARYLVSQTHLVG